MGSGSSDQGSHAVELRAMHAHDCYELGKKLRGDDQLELMLLSGGHNGAAGLERAWDESTESWAWSVDGAVVACGGVVRVEDGSGIGWLVCSDAALADRALFCRWARAALWLVCSRYPHLCADTLVSTGHGGWLEWLGFTPGEEREVEGFTFRRYYGTFVRE